MNTGPYSNSEVQKFVQNEFVAVKSQCFWDKRTEFMKRYTVSWTPTLLVLDPKGGEHHRVVGFVPEDDFVAHLTLGRGKMHFDLFRFAEALEDFGAVIEQHPKAGAVPEAVFYRGVAEYWKTHDPKGLRRAHDALKAQFPESEWARRAGPYGQIPL